MKIISVEGYKAFHGDMMITPKAGAIFKEPYYITGKDWLYKPDTNCWYGGGSSYPADICQIVDDNTYERDD